MFRTHTKTSVSYQHRVIEAHNYECYGNQTIPVGKVLHITKTPNRYKTYSLLIGHSASEHIPQNKIGVFKIDEKVVTTIRETPCENI